MGEWIKPRVNKQTKKVNNIVDTIKYSTLFITATALLFVK